VGIHRPTHLLKGLLVAGIAVAGLAGTSVVAHAYPPPKETHSLTCSPGTVSASGSTSTCTLTFTDKAKGEDANQLICFGVKGAGTVTGTFSSNCSKTNANGQATATFKANGSSCAGEGKSEGSAAKATIAGTEVTPRDEAGRAQTTVKITCPDNDNDKDNSPGSGSGSTTTTTSAHTTAATVAPLSAAQVVPVAAIAVVILVLSVAITGRLRLRRLRR
jgi:hypothetical protein